MTRRGTPMDRSASRALTLVELLAVITLIGATTMLALGGLVSRTTTAEIISLANAWFDLDARARLLARRGEGDVQLSIDAASRSLTLLTGRGDVISHRPIPASLEITLHGPHEVAIDAVRFDARGCSPDYRVRIRHADTAVLQTWSISGLTGWIAPQAEITPP